jgi:hypothetical protein
MCCSVMRACACYQLRLHTERVLPCAGWSLQSCPCSRVVSCGAVRYGAVLFGAVQCGALPWCGAVRCCAVLCCALWCAMVCRGVVWCGVVRCGVGRMGFRKAVHRVQVYGSNKEAPGPNVTACASHDFSCDPNCHTCHGTWKNVCYQCTRTLCALTVCVDVRVCWAWMCTLSTRYFDCIHPSLEDCTMPLFSADAMCATRECE